YQGIILDANDRFATMMGYTRAALIGMRAMDTVVAEDAEQVWAHQQAGDETPYLVHMRRLNGSTFLAECWGKAVPYEGKLARITTLRDLSEQEQAAAALRDSEQRYRELIQQSHGLICTHSLDGTLLSINHTAANVLGYEPDELIGHQLSDVMTPAAQLQLGAYLAQIARETTISGQI